MHMCTQASHSGTHPVCTHTNILLPRGEVSSPISQDSESGKKVMAGGMPRDFSSTTLGIKVHQGFWRMMGVPVPAHPVVGLWKVPVFQGRTRVPSSLQPHPRTRHSPCRPIPDQAFSLSWGSTAGPEGWEDGTQGLTRQPRQRWRR